MKGYFMAKNTFAVEVTFLSSSGTKPQIFGAGKDSNSVPW